MVGKVDITKTIMIMTRATAMTSITLFDMTTITMMMTRAMAMLPSENNDVDVNFKDAYANDVGHDDNN